MSVTTALFSRASIAIPPRRAAGGAITGELRGPITAGVPWRLPPRIYAPPSRRRGRRPMAVRSGRSI